MIRRTLPYATAVGLGLGCAAASPQPSTDDQRVEKLSSLAVRDAPSSTARPTARVWRRAPVLSLEAERKIEPNLDTKTTVSDSVTWFDDLEVIELRNRLRPVERGAW